MQRTLATLLMLGLATVALASATQAQESGEPRIDVKLFLNRTVDGKLGLTALAPSARNASTWSTSGHYSPGQGLSIKIPLVDPNPNWVIDESAGVDGWVTWSFKQSSTSSLSVGGGSYGTFRWMLVEGERSSQMTQACAEYNETYEYDCDRYEYRAAFPGHGAKPTPHTHGDGTDADRGLRSGDLEWVLTYTIPPCSSTSLCWWMYSTMKYEFSVLLDGTTFLHYSAINEDYVPPPPAAADPNATANVTTPGNETGGNGTDPGSGNQTGGNSTGNGTGQGQQPSSFRPMAYNAQDASGTAPGAGLAAILATAGVAVAIMRRRHD